MSRPFFGARAVLAVTAALAMTACTGTEPTPSPLPTQTSSPQDSTPGTQPTETSPSNLPEVTQDPAHARPLPDMPPESFGDWQAAEGTLRSDGGLYEHVTLEQLATVMYAPTNTAVDGLEFIDDAQLVGNWYCGVSTVDARFIECYTDAFDAQVYIMSDTMVPEEMVAFGDDLLTNWT